MAELAHASLDALAVDQALQAWFTAAASSSGIVGWAVDVVGRATTGSLPSVLTTAPADPSLLDELDPAPAIGATPPGIETPTTAAVSLRFVRTWLWQHPTRVHAVHLRLGTQVGLAVNHLASADADPLALRAWRRAVGFADDIERSPPTDDAALAAARLADVLSWVRVGIERDDRPRTDELSAELPRLADALLTGASAAVARGDLFVNRSRLEQTRGGVVRAKTIWVRADYKEGEIVGLRNALAAATADLDQQQSRVRAAFQRPPRPGTAITQVPTPDGGHRRHRRRT